LKDSFLPRAFNLRIVLGLLGWFISSRIGFLVRIFLLYGLSARLHPVVTFRAAGFLFIVTCVPAIKTLHCTTSVAQTISWLAIDIKSALYTFPGSFT
jgi:hypothetical protein